MQRNAITRLLWLTGFFLGLAFVPVQALVRLNDGRDKIFVTGTVAYSWDSNIFANSGNLGDYQMSAGLSAAYTRRAGFIGVDAGLSVNAAKYNKFSAEDFANPSMSLEFTKQTGRTTGSLGLSAARQSRADTAANIRNESWSYSTNLNLRYPVIERYSFSGGVTWSRRDFQNNDSLVDLDSIAANLNLFYVYTTERDLSAGYRYRWSRTTVDTISTDHGFNVGVSGRILARLNGSLSGGLQTRHSVSPTLVEDYYSWMMAMAATWNYSKRISLTANVGKDFSITSTNISTDSISANLNLNFTKSARWGFSAGVGWGHTEFLGVLGDGRVDDHFNASLSANYTMNDHLKISASYSYFISWSSLDYATYERSGYSLSLSSRW